MNKYSLSAALKTIIGTKSENTKYALIQKENFVRIKCYDSPCVIFHRIKKRARHLTQIHNRRKISNIALQFSSSKLNFWIIYDADSVAHHVERRITYAMVCNNETVPERCGFPVSLFINWRLLLVDSDK